MGTFGDTKEPLVLVCVANMSVPFFSKGRGLGLNDEKQPSLSKARLTGRFIIAIIQVYLLGVVKTGKPHK